MKSNYGKNLFLAIMFCIVVTLGLCVAAKQMIKMDKEREEKEVFKELNNSDNVQDSENKDNTVSDPKPDESKSETKITPEPDESKSEIKITPEPTDIPQDIVEPIEPTPVSTNPVKGKIIALDAGHQAKGNSEKEPLGPGSTEMKAKVSSGTTGVSTKVAEYILTLDIALDLKDELETRGYTVLMIRETHDINLSNRERAQLANEGADIFVRLHANGSENQNVSGALTIYPSESNEFVGNISKYCKKLAQAIIEEYCEEKEAKNQGAIVMDNMSGINWCTIPVTIIEMGYMSNPKEDEKMQDPEYQKKMVQGIANGIDAYFDEE